jgi:SAM-dependent methyltransferase
VTHASPIWQVACPRCRTDLGPLPRDDADGSAVDCPACTVRYERVDGIWRFLPPERAEHFERFLADYTAVRLAEGRGSDDAADYIGLPDPASGDPLAWQWSMRATTWRYVREKVMPAFGTGLLVLDVGAGVGWLSNRMDELGHSPVAIDLTVDGRDGLGAARHYAPRWPRVQAEFDRLPLAAGQADLVVFNASLHYSVDYAVTLGEAVRVLRPGGRVLVLDSPMYRHEESGARMVAERHADFARRFGTRSDSVPSIEYLTQTRLDAVADELGLEWSSSTPWYGWRWWARPWVAKLKRRREPSRFHVLVASTVGRRAEARR